MIASIKRSAAHVWNIFFDYEVSRIRNIPSVAVRYYVLQSLGLMWAGAFSIAIASDTVLAINVLGHTVLSAAAAITVATLTAAAKTTQVFIRRSGRHEDDNHD
ncbi:hypothetical protein [Cypionkella sp. TWP1-2-1b2]|uniref:hypothetical protein n=1 Tax=Cypionkella sp. TWP1-2-1b2 TaxID=2804675 RepID=UPI003CFB6194